jgi:hypothetical protein
MAGILVLTVIIGVLTALLTLIWWMMADSWIRKDRRARGRHVTESSRDDPEPGTRVIRDP